MRAVSLSLVINGKVTTGARRPSESWAGHVVVDVEESGYTVTSLYIAEDKARALIAQLTEALDSAPALVEAAG
jgi:predicted NBD/HSP70 family sugar kinase